jgi:hypothetical protein
MDELPWWICRQWGDDSRAWLVIQHGVKVPFWRENGAGSIVILETDEKYVDGNFIQLRCLFWPGRRERDRVIQCICYLSDHERREYEHLPEMFYKRLVDECVRELGRVLWEKQEVAESAR